MTDETADGLSAVLPLRDVVVFPGMVAPLFVGREQSVRALEHVMEADEPLLLVTQKNADTDAPSPDDLYGTGVVGAVLQLLKLPDDTMKVLVEGRRRVRVRAYEPGEDFLRARHVALDPVLPGDTDSLPGLMRALVRQFEEYVRLSRKMPSEAAESVARIDNPSVLTDTVAQHLSLKIADKQALLDNPNVLERIEKLFSILEAEIDMSRTEKKIRSRVKKQMEENQREYYLNEQMKAIQKELGEDSDSDLEALKKAIAKARLSKEARARAESELKKLRAMSPMSAEASVIRNYLDWLVAVPWRRNSRASGDIARAEGVLNADHYGLDKVKDRILEHLAVQSRLKKIRGPILCLVGPPGVGKTSLGRSIARATGRRFVRMSLGGVRDEAEIRGHRRTYVGAMPGRIIQGMKKAGASNPLFLLDEIDKLGADWRGDPSAALLEVLDPEQNGAFNDHYLDVDYDLSNVLFVTTANTMNMPQPLRDRMEIIRIPGYTEDEKLEIARRHLIPRRMADSGLKDGEWSITQGALRDLIRFYTREAGVRGLERALGGLCRKAVRAIMTDQSAAPVAVTARNLAAHAGVRRFRFGDAEDADQVGVATGLAWTEVGGEILSIEAVKTPGKGRIIKTGKLGDVMQESVLAAESWVKSRAPSLGIHPASFEKMDIHLHVPEGATPKDGPSAGVAMITAIVSALTGIPARHDVAMTGEITLRGRVLPIGGLKEKMLAALREGRRTVLIPRDNKKDLPDIPENVRKSLRVIPVDTVDAVLRRALATPLKPIEWSPDAPPARPAPTEASAEAPASATRH